MMKKLRSRLFGFKKADVYSYIAEMDEAAAKQIEEKNCEIEELKAKVAEYEKKIAELEKNKESVVSVLQVAVAKAKEITEKANADAETIRAEAARDAEAKMNEANREIQTQKELASKEIQEQKNAVNREIESKRKAINSYYVAENRKIEHIKTEVERMRKASMDAIQSFESQLHEVSRMTENSSSFLDSAKNYADKGVAPEQFVDIEQNIPVHFVESISD